MNNKQKRYSIFKYKPIYNNRIHFIIVAKDRNCYYYASSPNHTSYDYKNI